MHPYVHARGVRVQLAWSRPECELLTLTLTTLTMYTHIALTQASSRAAQSSSSSAFY